MHSYSTAVQRLATFGAVATLVVWSTCASPAQDKSKSQNPEEKALIARCSPRIKKKQKMDRKTFQVRTGEKPTGFSPLISFQITESGEVINAPVKRISGIRDEDNAALDFIKSGRYYSRPGCPLIDSESSVSIDLSAANQARKVTDICHGALRFIEQVAELGYAGFGPA
jgi:hypothetical protein